MLGGTALFRYGDLGQTPRFLAFARPLSDQPKLRAVKSQNKDLLKVVMAIHDLQQISRNGARYFCHVKDHTLWCPPVLEAIKTRQALVSG